MKELPLYAEQRGLDFAKLMSEIASPDVKGILESQLGDEAMPEAAYRAAIETHRPNMQRKWASYFKSNNLSAAIFPTTPLTARPIGQDETVDLNGDEVPTFPTFIKNTDHGSVIKTRDKHACGLTRGMPVGFELDGLPGADRELLAVAKDRRDC